MAPALYPSIVERKTKGLHEGVTLKCSLKLRWKYAESLQPSLLLKNCPPFCEKIGAKTLEDIEVPSGISPQLPKFSQRPQPPLL